MAASVRCGLAALAGADRVLVALADQPGLTPAAVRAVLDRPGSARAVYAGRPGHPVVLGPELLARAGELRGDAGFRDLLAGVPAVECGHLGEPLDIDTQGGSGDGGAMKLEHSFEVAAPVDQVWATLNDLEQVAPCLPGAAITGHDEDGTYHGTFQVKLGPATASYRGTIRIQEADEAAHTATLAAKGSDKRGQGGASATIVNTLHTTDDGGTRVEAVTDFTITGRLASFGRGGMIKDISNRLLGEFAACLQQRLSAVPEPAMTADDAAASAGAEARPEESAAGEAPAARPPARARHGRAAARRRPAAQRPPRPRRSRASPCCSRCSATGAKALAPVALEGLRKLAAALGGLVRSLLARVRARRPG